MSTHIEGGFRVSSGTDPFALIRHAKTALEPIRRRLVAEELAEQAAHVLHVSDLTGEAPARSPLSTAAKELADETVKGDWRGLNCRIGFATDPVTHRIHLLVLGSQDYIDAVAAIDGVEDYSYWNHCEGPAGVAEEDWEERRKSWNRVLPGFGHVGNNMAVWNLDADAMGIRLAARLETFEQIEACLPTPATRARDIVRDRIYACLDRHDPLDLSSSMSRVMRRLEESKRLSRTADFAAAAELAEYLLAPSDWETFGSGSSVSLLHANRDRVDRLILLALGKVQRQE